MGGDSLLWLTQWYFSQCDCDWEHAYGVTIGTLDNPGWTVRVDLAGTALEGRSFLKVAYGEPADDLNELRRNGSWWVAEVKDGAFAAACGPLDLPTVLDLFRTWAETA